MLAGPRKSQLLALCGAVGAAVSLASCGSVGSSSSSSSAPASSTAAATPVAATSSSAPSGGKKVGYISLDPVSSTDWERSNWQAMQAAAAKYHLQLSHQENVGFNQAASVLARLAQQGDNLIVADSSGYDSAILQVAPRYPKTTFVVFDQLTSTNGLKNVAGWSVDWNGLGYLGGASGCLAAKALGSSTVGAVSAQPIPALTHFDGGVKDGAAANGCKFLVTWTNSFTDTAAGKQAALTMIGKGAGAITSIADAGDQGSQQAANQQGKAFVANYSATPRALTSLVIHFDDSYNQIAGLWSSGQLKPQVYPVTIQNGLVSYATPFTGPGAAAQQQALAIQQKIKTGQIKVDQSSQVTS